MCVLIYAYGTSLVYGSVTPTRDHDGAPTATEKVHKRGEKRSMVSENESRAEEGPHKLP